jgi:hypothetical protein
MQSKCLTGKKRLKQLNVGNGLKNFIPDDDFILLVADTVQLWTLVCTVMNLWVSDLSEWKFFLLQRPNLFAICNNTFSKWWEG